VVQLREEPLVLGSGGAPSRPSLARSSTSFEAFHSFWISFSPCRSSFVLYGKSSPTAYPDAQ